MNGAIISKCHECAETSWISKQNSFEMFAESVQSIVRSVLSRVTGRSFHARGLDILRVICRRRCCCRVAVLQACNAATHVSYMRKLICVLTLFTNFTFVVFTSFQLRLRCNIQELNLYRCLCRIDEICHMRFFFKSVHTKQQIQAADDKKPRRVSLAHRNVTKPVKNGSMSINVAVISWTVALAVVTVFLLRTAFPNTISDAPTNNERRLFRLHIWKRHSPLGIPNSAHSPQQGSPKSKTRGYVMYRVAQKY